VRSVDARAVPVDPDEVSWEARTETCSGVVEVSQEDLDVGIAVHVLDEQGEDPRLGPTPRGGVGQMVGAWLLAKWVAVSVATQ
jgi:hypothetical protein